MVARAKLRSSPQKDRLRNRRASWSVAAATCYAGYAGCHCFAAEMANRAIPENSPRVRGIDEGLRRRGEGGLDARDARDARDVDAAVASDSTSSASGYRSCLRALSFLGVHRACGFLTARRRSRQDRDGNLSSLRASELAGEAMLESCPPPVLYKQRWVQLAFLALLALLSDLVCFSVAATPATWTKVFGQDPATLIDIFLFTNVFACFIEPFIIRTFGLRIPIVAAAVLMAVGCWLRSGLPFSGDELPGYGTVVAGTMLVAVAQPFFQCTPPLLSATWFAPDERAMSTAVAINFNQVGIAAAFIAGGAMGGSEAGLKTYFVAITLLSTVVAAASLIFFQERPPTPPSASELEKLLAEKSEKSGALKAEVEGSKEASKAKPEDSFPKEAWRLITTPGFLPPLAAFVTSIAVTNVVGAFMDLKLQRAGFTDAMEVDMAGAGFEVAIVIGGIILGGLVDRNKEYKSVTMWCIAATLVGVLLLGIESLPRSAALVALLAIGSFAGPVQPINAELAVEVTYPCDENAIEAVQQLCGNLVSALLVPVCEWAAELKFSLPGSDGYLRGDTLLLLGILVVACTSSIPQATKETNPLIVC
ncbi:unnamed protein product [Symbiodinium natans]|uniref:Major facilitator superfamily (MFS) profile domain-containing protein n=1 Tax=Symbiodinium natans TaxID=878477 RepID=A0A812VEZ0_9DINO|nr:unnamed protein product [Symbiodinium natans]